MKRKTYGVGLPAKSYRLLTAYARRLKRSRAQTVAFMLASFAPVMDSMTAVSTGQDMTPNERAVLRAMEVLPGGLSPRRRASGGPA